MSPRAAWRLESLGFTDVYDYVPGKTDWAAAGLPMEGTAGPTVGALARGDVPTCGLGDELTEVRRRVRASAWETCIVVNEEEVVLGLLGRSALASSDGGNVEEVMAPGPSTVRPSLLLTTMAERMERRALTSALVTTSDGRLFGIIFREDLERALSESLPD